MPLLPGISGRVELVVSDADTASALRSGDVPVLGTPRVVALVEEAACQAISNDLDDGQTTVGASIQLDHVAPTPVGDGVVAEATLAKVEGRRLTFTVRVTDARGLVAAGKHTRAIVKRQRFLENAGVEE
ncbi:MAG TPA: hotdog domain-containing protein [Acidimicrobiia bacterium]|nr:hotdog domain-containing protein [Acidimicrobiia bacterium]